MRFLQWIQGRGLLQLTGQGDRNGDTRDLHQQLVRLIPAPLSIVMLNQVAFN